MKKKLQEQIHALIAELGADEAEHGKPWNGYEVYIPVYHEVAYVGLPLVVLVKGDEIRLSTGEEGLDYLATTEDEDGEEAEEL